MVICKISFLYLSLLMFSLKSLVFFLAVKERLKPSYLKIHTNLVVKSIVKLGKSRSLLVLGAHRSTHGGK